MRNYMDDSFAIVGDTIIAYNGEHEILKVPTNFADITVSKIGGGSFMHSTKLQCVVLPPTIKEIGELAFSNCPALTSVFMPGSVSRVGTAAFTACENISDVTIYDLELTASEYNAYKAGANKNDDGIYVLRQLPKKELIDSVLFALLIPGAVHEMPDDIQALFHLKTPEQPGKLSLEKKIPVIGFTVPSVPVTENEAFMRRLAGGNVDYKDEKTEQEIDNNIRMGRVIVNKAQAVLTFDDKKTKQNNGSYFITATLKIGHFFWQSAQQIMYERKRYYIYSRCYLTAQQDMKYVRHDIALYTDEGVVTDREEAMAVYAKYKLLSIL